MAGMAMGMGMGFTSRQNLGGRPDFTNLQSWYKSRVDSVLVDEVSAANKVVLFPVSGIIATSVMEGIAANSVTIVSYEGDQLLSVSGDDIISSGIGEVHSLLLSDGTFIPLPNLGNGIKNGALVEFEIVDIIKSHNDDGSTYLHDKGCVKVNPNITPELYWLNINNWALDTGVLLDINDKFIEITNSTAVFNNAKLNINLNTDTEYTFIIEILENTYTGGAATNVIIRDIGFIDNKMIISTGMTGILTHTARTLSSITNPYIWSFLSPSGNNGEIIKYRIISVKLTTPDIIPSNLDKQPLAIGENIPQTNFLNKSLAKIDYSSDLIWDKSNVLIWKQPIRDSLNMNLANVYEWDIEEHEQGYIDDNIQPAYAGRIKIDERNNRLNHILIYNP